MNNNNSARELGSLDAAVVLLDEWIAYAEELERENARLLRRYINARERCMQLRAIVAEDYPG